MLALKTTVNDLIQSKKCLLHILPLHDVNNLDGTTHFITFQCPVSNTQRRDSGTKFIGAGRLGCRIIKLY